MELWITARGAGLALLCLLSISAALGLVASTGALTGADRAVVQYIHRACALLAVAMLALHVTAIVLDSYSGVGVAGAVVPLASGYRPIAVGLGVLAAYSMLATTALGLARPRFAASERAAAVWRAAHIAGASLWVLAVLHGLLAGSDTGAGWGRALLLGCVALVAAAGIARAALARSDRSARRDLSARAARGPSGVDRPRGSRSADARA